jgi:hypothetical protein
MVVNSAKVMSEVTALAGATQEYVVQTATEVEENALRMAGRL